MPFHDLYYDELIKGLIDNFTILADEVQLLGDRNTILEHKLRFAHEQYQYLADKYASGDPEISKTLAKLLLPPDLEVATSDRAGFVPLPLRKKAASKIQTAVIIRDGRRAAQKLATITGRSSGSTVSGKSISGSSSNMRTSARRTTLSTVLEQDFTVQGKRSSLACPFAPPTNATKVGTNQSASQASVTPDSDHPHTPLDMEDRTPHHSADPICAAMYAETMPSAPPSANGSAAKCPIRFLDQHSPEEVARYFETHKHEIPRSHEICVKRYQRNEDDIRKLDAKYGNLVSMIQGLGQKHQPLLPEKDDEPETMEIEVTEQASNERVENWAHDVSANGASDGEEGEEAEGEHHDEEDRESRFDRPLKEIRVGESPSRPWGISVPILEPLEGQRPISPPPAPVSTEHLPKATGGCPFARNTQPQLNVPETPFKPTIQVKEEGAPKCPFHKAQVPQESSFNHEEQIPQPFAGAQAQGQNSPPAFIQTPEVPKHVSPGVPQMIFTGPVFIGYPMEQAIAFMQQYRGGN